MDNAFDDLLGAKDKLKGKIRTSLEGKLVTALLVGCILVSAFLSVVKFDAINPFDPALWLRLGNQLLTSYLVFLMFIDPGERSEILSNAEHGEIRRHLIELSTAISAGGLMAQFRAFCRKKETERLEDRRRYIYGRYLDDEQYAALSACKDLKTRYKAGEITKKEYKVVKRAVKASLAPYHPEQILTSDPASPRAKLDGRVTYRQKKVFQRPVMLVVWNIIINSMAFAGAEAFSIGMLITILTSTFSIAISAFVGYDVGRNSALWTTAQRQQRIAFLQEFEEWNRKKINDSLFSMQNP